MDVVRNFSAEHADFIHDVSFDFYGKRLATCSGCEGRSRWRKSASSALRRRDGSRAAFGIVSSLFSGSRQAFDR